MFETVRSFGAMGSTCSITITVEDHRAADRLAERAEAMVHQLEALWTRFRSDSELMGLNEHAGQEWGVSPDTFALISAAIEARALTGGLFDPTLLDALIDAGYDRSFDQIVDGDRPAVRSLHDQSMVDEIDLDAERLFVTLPAVAPRYTKSPSDHVEVGKMFRLSS
ncbi:MAG: FAD:protein FMN transferase [Actinobacteria bacterium]|nr:FAD:protein FMN transferase [Actinomycetota bacterium]